MNARRWSKVTHAKAADVAPRADLEGPAAALLAPDAPPESFHEALIDKKLAIDAIRFLAQALPPRETVFWALSCVRETGPTDPADGQLLVLAERWVKSPNDDAGRAAFALAEKGGFKTAAAWVAVACFWSGPSLAPANVPAVPPAPGLAGKAASGAILLAAVAGKAQDAPKMQKKFLAIGESIASGATPLPK